MRAPELFLLRYEHRCCRERAQRSHPRARRGRTLIRERRQQLRLDETMSGAGSTLGAIPLLGDVVWAPFDEASGAGAVLADAGRDQQQLASALAGAAGPAMVGLPLRCSGCGRGCASPRA